MLTTSSPTSSRRSSGLSRTGLSAWLTLATILIVLGFVGQAVGGTNSDVFYDYGLALSSLVIYGILVGLTVWAGTAYGNPFEALGARRQSSSASKKRSPASRPPVSSKASMPPESDSWRSASSC